MGAAAEKLHIREADYLNWESRSNDKHEYVAGQIFAMAGASEHHNRIAGNVFFHLRQATRGHPCRAFISDMKLRIADCRSYYYPDVMLVCDERDNEPMYKTAPCLIAEVLSPSTATTDQREKWLAYQTIPSLHYYLLVDAERWYVRLLTRIEGDHWTEQILDREESVEIACSDMRIVLGLEDFYEDTRLLP